MKATGRMKLSKEAFAICTATAGVMLMALMAADSKNIKLSLEAFTLFTLGMLLASEATWYLTVQVSRRMAIVEAAIIDAAVSMLDQMVEGRHYLGAQTRVVDSTLTHNKLTENRLLLLCQTHAGQFFQLAFRVKRSERSCPWVPFDLQVQPCSDEEAYRVLWHPRSGVSTDDAPDRTKHYNRAWKQTVDIKSILAVDPTNESPKHIAWVAKQLAVKLRLLFEADPSDVDLLGFVEELDAWKTAEFADGQPPAEELKTVLSDLSHWADCARVKLVL